MGAALGIAAFLVAVAYWPGIAGAALTPRWLVVGAASVLLFGITHIRTTPAHRWFAFLLAWAAVSITFEPVFWEGLNGWIQLAMMAMLFCLGAETDDLRPVYAGFAAGITVNALFIIPQELGYTPVAWTNLPAGLFFNRTFFGEAAALALVGAIGSRLWWLVPGPLAATIMAQNRGSWLGIGLVGVVMLWRKNRLLSAAVMCALPVAFVLTAIYGRWYGPLERYYLWRDALDGLTIFGNGIGSFYSMVTFYGHRLDGVIREAHAHNDTLELAFELGAPGLVAAAAIVWAAFRAPGRFVDKMVLVAFLGEGLVGFPAHMPATGLVGFIVAGSLCGSFYRLRQPVDVRTIPARLGLAAQRRESNQSNSATEGCGRVPA